MRANRKTFLAMGLAIVLATGAAMCSLATAADSTETNSNSPDKILRQRLERSLDRWCRWLASNLKPIPGTDLYTFHPTLEGYRAVAGNQFAAAAAGCWLARNKPEEEISRPLRGLIKLALGTHVAVKEVYQPELILPWGATYSGSDNWHADLFAGTSGMLMANGLSPREREQLLKILAWEADQQIEFGFTKKNFHVTPRLGGRSVGESNAWSTALLQAARMALPHDPRQAAWRDSAIRYSLNTICMPADMKSSRVVAGQPLAQWVKGANFEPGGIQEHHGFYHPGYMGWPLAYQAYAQLIDENLPKDQQNPDVYLNNWQPVFERLKQATLSNGRFIYCAGSDWISYGYGNAHILPIGIFAAARFGDADAARLADQWLAIIEREQALSGGAAQGARLAAMQRLRPKDFGWYEAISGASLAQALWVMDHIDTSKMPRPATEEEYNARNTGTYLEPGARLVWHRDRHRWASFSWRTWQDACQAIVQPVGQPNLLGFNRNATGGVWPTGPANAIQTKAKVLFNATATFPRGGFWSMGTVERAIKTAKGDTSKIRQHQALVALPDGPSIFIDQCQALDELQIQRTAGLGLRLAADVFNNNHVKITSNGAERAFAQHPQRDTWHDLQTRSVTIEGRMAIHAIAGKGSFHLLQKRSRPPDRSFMIGACHDSESLLCHELYFGPPANDTPRIVGPQEWFRKMVLVLYCDPASTPKQTTAIVTGKHPCFAVDLPELKQTIAVNFAESEKTTDSKVGRITISPRSVRILP